MTSFATFQTLQDAVAGIVRIYGAELSLYQWCLKVVIDGDTATVEGELDQGITQHDFQAMGHALASQGIKKLAWQYKGKECFINVTPYKIPSIYD